MWSFFIFRFQASCIATSSRRTSSSWTTAPATSGASPSPTSASRTKSPPSRAWRVESRFVKLAAFPHLYTSCKHFAVVRSRWPSSGPGRPAHTRRLLKPRFCCRMYVCTQRSSRVRAPWREVALGFSPSLRVRVRVRCSRGCPWLPAACPPFACGTSTNVRMCLVCRAFRRHQLMGTPSYMAPESILHGMYGKEVDW